jgi:hypothetical protein
MVLYMAPIEEFDKFMADSTPEQQKEAMDGWMGWMTANQESIVDGGPPLGKTKRVDGEGVSDTRNEIGGYTIVQAESPDEAPSCSTRIIPTSPCPGRGSRSSRSCRCRPPACPGLSGGRVR